MIRRGLAVLLTIAVGATIGALTRAPYALRTAEDAALIRLAWRAARVRVEACRPPTEAELATTPLHMRPTEICEGGSMPYRLTVTVDGRPVIDTLVAASGARGEGPVYVFEEFPVATGERAIAVQFRADAPLATADSLPPLVFVSSLTLGPGEIALITRDGGSGSLVARGYGWEDSQ